MEKPNRRRKKRRKNREPFVAQRAARRQAEEEAKSRLAQEDCNWGIAGPYFSKLEVTPGDDYIVLSRVSASPQSRNGNGNDQDQSLRKLIEAGGGNVIIAIRHVGRGCETAWLESPLALARKKKATVVAESVDRIVRHPKYDPKNQPDLQADIKQLKEVYSMADGVVMMTYLEPNAKPRQIRSQQTIRGKAAKKMARAKLAAGYMKKRRIEKSPEVNRLRKLGLSPKKIVRHLNVSTIPPDKPVSLSTVRRWIGFTVLDLIGAYLPMGYLGGMLGGTKKPQSPFVR